MADNRKPKSRGDENRLWGKEAEKIAVDYLIGQGYVIRETNWRHGNHIEIDIIAQEGNTIIFVEVKARKGDFTTPEEAVNEAKMKKIIKGGDIYLNTLKHLFSYRLDVITIVGTPDNYTLNHLPDAYLPPLT